MIISANTRHSLHTICIGTFSGNYIMQHFIDLGTIWIRTIYQDRGGKPQLLIRTAGYPTETWRNNDAMITSSVHPNDVGDVVWTWWRRYYCVVCPLGRYSRVMNMWSTTDNYKHNFETHWFIASLRHQLKTFCVTRPLCGEFTGDGWIPLTKASDAELWCFF